MSQPITYNNNINDGATARRYTGYPLNSTLVSSYTPDTIRSIINHAATGQPYSTSVWIRISRVGIQISAQDPQIARSRTPVFIPIGLVHDIYMQPSINNIICVVYDEPQSNMKGVLLYVVHPTDAQLLRDDFRIVKQANTTQPSSYSIPLDSRYVNETYVPPTTDPYRNNITVRQQSPKRILYVRDNDIKREITPISNPLTLPPSGYLSSKGSYNSEREDASRRRRNKSPRKNRGRYSPGKQSSDSGTKHRRKHRSRSPEKKVQQISPGSTNTQGLTQQQQMAAWQATQQMPLIPMGIYNRYVPKTIPLPTGETLKTSLPPPGLTNGTMNGSAVAYIEPQNLANARPTSRSLSRSRSNSPPSHQQQYRNRSTSAQNAEGQGVLSQSVHHHRRHHHRHHNNHDNTYAPSKPNPNTYATVSRTRNKTATPKTNDDDGDTKQYLKKLVDEMEAMKLEMNRIRRSPMPVPKGRSDSVQIDLKQLRADIDTIRARIAMTPKIRE